MLSHALIIGASGQVGRAIARALDARRTPWTGTYACTPVERLSHLDLRNAAAVRETIHRANAPLVFLPGAMTYVDGAELHPADAHAINVDGTAHVAQACKEIGSILIYFSTEHVFGESETPHAEDDPTSPVSVYAKTKLLGEQRIRDLLPDRHLILRTSWVFGHDDQQKNFVYRALRTLRNNQPLEVPFDQYGQPTFSIDLASVALSLIGKRGTFHVTGPTLLTRLDFAQLIAATFHLPTTNIRGKLTAELNQPAPRPRRVELLRQKLLATMQRDPIRSPEQALSEMRDGVHGLSP